MSQKYQTFIERRAITDNGFPFSRRVEVTKEILPHLEGLECERCKCLVSLFSEPVCPRCGGKMKEKVIVTL